VAELRIDFWTFEWLSCHTDQRWETAVGEFILRVPFEQAAEQTLRISIRPPEAISCADSQIPRSWAMVLEGECPLCGCFLVRDEPRAVSFCWSDRIAMRAAAA
jgi:hypothetical protein